MTYIRNIRDNRDYTIRASGNITINTKSSEKIQITVAELLNSPETFNNLRKQVKPSILNDMFVDLWHQIDLKMMLMRRYYGE